MGSRGNGIVSLPRCLNKVRTQWKRLFHYRRRGEYWKREVGSLFAGFVGFNWLHSH